MLKAEEINFLLDALYASLKEKIPNLKPPSVSGVEGVRSVGTYGPLVLAGLFVGEVEGKATVVIEWDTAFKLATKILKVSKLETFTEEAQLALEEVVKNALEKTAVEISKRRGKTELCLLPTLTDTSVLLSLYPDADVVRLLIETLWEPIQLYLAFPKEERPLTKESSRAA